MIIPVLFVLLQIRVTEITEAHITDLTPLPIIPGNIQYLPGGARKVEGVIHPVVLHTDHQVQARFPGVHIPPGLHQVRLQDLQAVAHVLPPAGDKQ